MKVYLASCPPISKIVSTSGSKKTAAAAWATISLTIPVRHGMQARDLAAEPVTPRPVDADLVGSGPS